MKPKFKTFKHYLFLLMLFIGTLSHAQHHIGFSAGMQYIFEETGQSDNTGLFLGGDYKVVHVDFSSNFEKGRFEAYINDRDWDPNIDKRRWYCVNVGYNYYCQNYSLNKTGIIITPKVGFLTTHNIFKIEKDSKTMEYADYDKIQLNVGADFTLHFNKIYVTGGVGLQGINVSIGYSFVKPPFSKG